MGGVFKGGESGRGDPWIACEGSERLGWRCARVQCWGMRGRVCSKGEGSLVRKRAIMERRAGFRRRREAGMG